LIDWISHFNKPHPKLFLVHGEEEAKLVLQQKLVEQGWSANIPGSGESISF
jgi:Cft2 family RNA processing exonuclease